jgi:hypothetical protein
MSLGLTLRIHHVGLQGWISEVSQFEKTFPPGLKPAPVFGAFAARLHSLLKKSLFSPLTFLWR